MSGLPAPSAAGRVVTDRPPQERTCRSHPERYPDASCRACRRRPGWLRMLVEARRAYVRERRERDPGWLPDRDDLEAHPSER